MRDTFVIIGLAVVAAVVGAFLYFGENVPSASPSVASSARLPAVAVPFTPLARGSKSTVATRVNYLITSADGLTKLWKMVDATSTPPTIDFNKEAVIAVFAGQQATTGYEIAVAKVMDTGAREVSVLIAKPDGGCSVKKAVTAPYEIVTMPATELPLTHQDLIATTTCTN